MAVRGLYLAAPKPNEIPLAVSFIREALPKETVNVLVMEFDYRYSYVSHPEVVDADALSKADVKAIVAACHGAGVRLIPLINLLGHQSWEAKTFGLLRAHPEFDETPKKYPNNQGIYCRSYCPLHPDLHQVVFALTDELAEACEADAVQVWMRFSFWPILIAGAAGHVTGLNSSPRKCVPFTTTSPSLIARCGCGATGCSRVT